jgi:hypothetical protein
MRIALGLFLVAAAAHAEGFEMVKALAGNWNVSEDGSSTKASFEVISRGNAVVQKSGFTAVYYPDNLTIGLMLFPDDGNAQRFRCEIKPNLLECALVEVSNAHVVDGHFRSVTISFQDKNTMVQKWMWQKKGWVPKPTELKFKRVQ